MLELMPTDHHHHGPACLAVGFGQVPWSKSSETAHQLIHRQERSAQRTAHHTTAHHRHQPTRRRKTGPGRLGPDFTRLVPDELSIPVADLGFGASANHEGPEGIRGRVDGYRIALAGGDLEDPVSNRPAGASYRRHHGLTLMQADAGIAATPPAIDPEELGSHKLVASSAPVNGDEEMKGLCLLPSGMRPNPAEFSFADYEAKDCGSCQR
ncbi:hypothetical protein ACJZ2D_009119 [Fusarium nematophilum]